ncbi:MAG: ABC transporter transmembrane domain-containing protein [Patescibacteria group bacterium]
MTAWYNQKVKDLTLFLDNQFYQKLFPNRTIDFNKGWLDLFLSYKWVLVGSFVFLAIEKIIEALSPFLISYLFEMKSFWVFYLLVFLFLISFVFSVIGFQLALRLTMRICDDVDNAVTEKVLCMDPVYNSTKSSTTIVSKLKRGIGSISVIVFNLFIDLPTKIIYVGMSIFWTFTVNFGLGLTLLLFAIISIVINVIYIKVFFKAVKKQSIETDDQYVGVVLENISQSQLIRATFATTERFNLMKDKQIIKNIDSLIRDHSYSIMYQITKGLLVLSMLFLTLNIYSMYIDSKISLSLSIAIITSYILASFQIIVLGSQVIKIFNAISETDDMLKYMKDAGQQSYPVLKK